MKQKYTLWYVNGRVCTDNEMKEIFRKNYVQVITNKDEYEKAKEYLIKECNWTEDMFFNNTIVKIKSYNTYIYDDINYRIYDYIPSYWTKLDGDYTEDYEEDIDDMELNDTAELMTSADYKDRFKAEYYQVEIRYKKLGEMLEKYEKNELDFKPKCSYPLLLNQYRVMGEYLELLKLRARIEEIGIESVDL